MVTPGISLIISCAFWFCDISCFDEYASGINSSLQCCYASLLVGTSSLTYWLVLGYLPSSAPGSSGKLTTFPFTWTIMAFSKLTSNMNLSSLLLSVRLIIFVTAHWLNQCIPSFRILQTYLVLRISPFDCNSRKCTGFYILVTYSLLQKKR